MHARPQRRTLPGMDPVRALQRYGGVASWQQLRLTSTARVIRRAVAGSTIVRVTRNRYALPTAKKARLAAARLTGTVSHLSAAAHWGWEVKQQPALPHVTVPRGRNVPAPAQLECAIHWTDLTAHETEGLVTSRLRTVLDCARSLPFDEALAVVDSALRHGLDREELVALAVTLRGPGAARVRRVVELADKRAANPFESVLRALALEAGLVVEPQRAVVVPSGTVHPDLVADELRLVIEGDSWTWHAASRKDHDRDCVRYNELVVAGWRVLRFTYQQVMHEPDHVLGVLRAVARPSQR